MTAKLDQIYKLLQETTSKEIVQNFLKNKGLHYSGTWDEVYSKRIIPALEANQLTEVDLIELLRDCEEYGRQHIFLYKCDPVIAKKIIDQDRVKTILKENNLTDLLNDPVVLNMPDKPTFSDIRWDTATINLALTVKIIETRRVKQFLGEVKDGFKFSLNYEYVPERVVNIAKLSHDGSLEVRLQSNSNSNKYEKELKTFRDSIDFLIPQEHFTEVSLQNAKTIISSNPEKFHDELRVNDSVLENDLGNKLRGVTGSKEMDLNSDDAATNSLQSFLKEDGFCTKSNVWFIAKENILSSDVHVILAGEVNEIAIPANCTKLDYNYVLDRLQTFNK
ncbi:MAG: hypothetical protein Q7T88_07285 [Methylotenera sp.]|nr:hypothetical protein [Methylotenera sp.]